MKKSVVMLLVGAASVVALNYFMPNLLPKK